MLSFPLWTFGQCRKKKTPTRRAGVSLFRNFQPTIAWVFFFVNNENGKKEPHVFYRGVANKNILRYANSDKRAQKPYHGFEKLSTLFCRVCQVKQGQIRRALLTKKFNVGTLLATRAAYQQTNMQINCGYYNPQNALGGAPSSTEPFAFASSTCESVPYSTSTATNTIGIIDGMTFDGVVATVFLFLITAILFYGVIMKTQKNDTF